MGREEGAEVATEFPKGLSLLLQGTSNELSSLRLIGPTGRISTDELGRAFENTIEEHSQYARARRYSKPLPVECSSLRGGSKH